MLKNIKPRTTDQKGFTIIEVLIVLAIAALILLIVFLAVPSLQRNSRNTQRKNDIAALAGAINEFVSNNGGAAPVAADVTGPSGGAISNVRLGFYDSNNVFGHAAGAGIGTVSANGTTAASGVLTVDDVQVYIGDDCSGGATSAPVKGSTRSIAIEYAVERSGGTILQCESS